MRQYILLLAILIGCKTYVQGQQIADLPGEPIVGKPCPAFYFDKVDFYPKKSVSLADFKGKWLVMDFWSRDCSSCLGDFPSVKRAQEELKDSVQYLMVTYDDAKGANRKIYRDYTRKLKLNMPSAFDDSSMTFFKQFNIGLLPRVVVVDPNGIVRILTGHLPIEKLKSFMAGGSPVFAVPSLANDKNAAELPYDFKWDVPYLVNGNGGNDSVFLFRSLLTKATSPRTPPNIRVDFEKGIIEATRFALGYLYRIAYFGKIGFKPEDPMYNVYWAQPVLEMRDSSLFQSDYWALKNMFCYSLTVDQSKASEGYMKAKMQETLKDFFNYDVSFEDRKMPYWRLTANDSAKIHLKTKGGPSSSSGNASQTSVKNKPVQFLIRLLSVYAGTGSSQISIADETGIKDNIDLDLDWVWNDFDIAKKELNRHGLDLTMGEKNMKVLVIRDKK